MKTSKFLEEAKKHIEHGWCQFALYGGNGSVCSIGALSKTTRGIKSSSERERIYGTSMRFLAAAIDPRFMEQSPFTTSRNAIVSFNDSSSTTKEQVLAKFDKAIKAAKECEEECAKR